MVKFSDSVSTNDAVFMAMGLALLIVSDLASIKVKLFYSEREHFIPRIALRALELVAGASGALLIGIIFYQHFWK